MNKDILKGLLSELSAEFGDPQMARQQEALKRHYKKFNSQRCQFRPGCRLFGTDNCNPSKLCQRSVTDRAIGVGETEVADKGNST